MIFMSKPSPARTWIIAVLVLTLLFGFAIWKLNTKDEQAIAPGGNETLSESTMEEIATNQPAPSVQPESKGKRGARLSVIYTGFCSYIDSLKETTAASHNIPAGKTVEDLAYRMYGDFNAMLAIMKDTVHRNELRKRPPYSYASPNAVKRMFNNVSLATAMLMLDRLKTDCRSLYTEVNSALNRE